MISDLFSDTLYYFSVAQTNKYKPKILKNKRYHQPPNALHQIIVQKPHAANLMRLYDPGNLRRDVNVGFVFGVADVDNHAAPLVGLVELVISVHARVAGVFVGFVGVRVALVFRDDDAVVVR